MTDDLLTKLAWMAMILLMTMLGWHCGRRYESAVRRQRRRDRHDRQYGNKGT